MATIKTEPTMEFKDIQQILKSLRDKVQYAQRNLQPVPSKGSICTVMLTHNLVEPDWIVIPCNEQIFGLVVCQKGLNETKWVADGPLYNKTSMATCQQSTFYFKSMCIMFKKYIIFTNFSKLQYENNANILELNNLEILKEYFTYIQHFYSQPIQFTISINLTNSYLSYRPVHTQNFLKMTWIQIQNTDSISKYDGYMLFTTKSAKIKTPSNIFQCKDGTYIDETSVCDKISDCKDGTDEKICNCNNTADNAATCKYIPDGKSLQKFCSPFYFTCLSSQKCIPYGKVCNSHIDCMYAEDEICENQNVINKLPISTFTCTKSNIAIPSFLVDDLIPDCPSIEDELQYFNLITDPSHIHIFCNSNKELPCVPGHTHCFQMDKLCVFEFQYNTTILKHCRNGAHLYNCTNFQCSEHFKCQMSYCTPFELICDGKWDCPQGDDEINCQSFSFPNLFKCKNQTKCLHLSKICNNKNDCQFGDDELWCIHDSLLVCPKECTCFSQSIICSHFDEFLYHHIWISVKYFKCFSCNILQSSSNHLSIFQSILFLNIKDYLFSSSCISKDNSISIIFSLKHLDISFNRLITTRSFCFISLKNLTIFYLQHNLISNVEDNSFYLLLSLQLLDLSRNKIKKLKKYHV